MANFLCSDLFGVMYFGFETTFLRFLWYKWRSGTCSSIHTNYKYMDLNKHRKEHAKAYSHQKQSKEETNYRRKVYLTFFHMYS